MKDIRNGMDEVILLADKVNVMVVMERDHYDRKARELFKNNSTYLLYLQESKISRVEKSP